MTNFAVLSSGLCRIRARTSMLVLGVAILTGIPASVANAQATYTADRINGFSVFGGASGLNTDYGVNDYGYMFGGDLTHSVGLRFIVPSLELRYTGSTGPAITEKSYLVGLKVETKFRRLHPYADFMVGYGQIKYVQYGQGDDSIAYNVGVGADYQVFGPWSVKVDAQEQYWKLGQATSALTPTMASVGVLYRIPAGFGRSRK